MHYHLIGIAGTAMGSLAGLLREAGHHVTGSDANVYPPMSTQLHELGIEYSEGFSPSNLDPRPDVVIVGNAISRGNPELEAVLDRGLYYTSAAVTIKDELLRGKHVIAVAGTHGKTTTTSMLAWALEAAGLNPSFLIGGVAENFGTSFRLTGSEYFVIEADEYDTAYFDKGPKMWHYLPRTAILNNVEFDHADIYRDEIAYEFAFERFVNLVPRTGTLVAGWDSPAVRRMAARSWAPVQGFSYGDQVLGGDGARSTPEVVGTSSTLTRPALGEQPRWTAIDVDFGELATTFRVLHEGREWGQVEMPAAGAFNVRNCLAVIAAAHAIGADPAGVREGLRTFKSVRRRMEIKGTVGGVTVIDDFAHHPTAVAETLAAARQRYRERPVIAVFEPRSYTAQRRDFQEAYIDAFNGADAIILAGLFHPERYTAETMMNPDEVVSALRGAGKSAHHIPAVEDIIDHLMRTVTGREVVLFMSNGGFGGIHGRLLDALAARA